MYLIQNKETSEIVDKKFNTLEEAREYAKELKRDLENRFIENNFYFYSENNLSKSII